MGIEPELDENAEAMRNDGIQVQREHETTLRGRSVKITRTLFAPSTS